MKMLIALVILLGAALVAQELKPAEVKDVEVTATDGTHSVKDGEVSFPGISNAGRLADVIANYPAKAAALALLRDTAKTNLAKAKNDAAQGK